MGGSKLDDVNIYVHQPLLGGGGGVWENLENMKCSRSDSRPILGLLRVSSLIKCNPYINDIFLQKIDSFNIS